MRAFLLALLTGLALPLTAKGPAEETPLSLEVHGLGSAAELKDFVDRGGIGGSWSFAFYDRNWRRGTISLGTRLGYNDFSNGSTKREAHLIDAGFELTLYPFRPHQGWYIKVAPTLSLSSLTNRDNGTLQEQRYARAMTVLSTGWRFRNGICAEALYQSVNIDERMNLSSYGAGLRVHF